MEWNLTFKACALFAKMVDLATWATAVTTDDGEVYYILYRTKMHEELPCLGSSVTTISKYIKELEDKKLIESIQKKTRPAYRLTAKGKEWVSEKTNTNVGENKKSKKKEISPEKEKEDGKFTFNLKKKSEYINLSTLYKENLRLACQVYAEKEKIDLEEVGYFIDWHSSKGTLFKDWGAGFKSWCRKHKEFRGRSNSNGGDFKKSDYFSNNGQGLL